MSSPQNETIPDMDFCTLGMFIIDEIHYHPSSNKAPVHNVLGGAGSYSALGARLFSPAPTASRRVGWIVDAGSDFPAELRAVVARWETGVLLRETPERLTTRGWNGYGVGEQRAFKYLTPKLRLHDGSLTPELLRARSFHLICSPARCIELVRGIMLRRAELSAKQTNGSAAVERKPLFIWEPVPDLCVPEELQRCYEALRLVDAVSPNHGELCGFFGKAGSDERGNALLDVIEECCADWLDKGIGADGKGSVVVRAGKDGCLVATRNGVQWLPAYHVAGSDKVVDPTGGGNAFLGGFAVGLVRSSAGREMEMVVEAALWGSVAASFAIEQVGVPTLRFDPGNGETWNGERVLDRLESFRRRINSSIQP